MTISGSRPSCPGTLVEHELGPAECTDDDCSTAPEQHWLVVTCEQLTRCCRHDDRRGADR